MADSLAHNVMSPTTSLVSLSLCRDINKKTLHVPCHLHMAVFSVCYTGHRMMPWTWLPGSAHHGAVTIANWSPPTACKSQILASHHLVVVFLKSICTRHGCSHACVGCIWTPAAWSVCEQLVLITSADAND